MKKDEFLENYKKLEDYLKLENWKLEKCNEPSGICDFQTKTVYYNPILSDKNKIYVILHECGHKIIEKSKKLEFFKYGQSLKSRIDKRLKKSFLFRVEVLREEYEAWDSAWKLAKDLDIRLNMKDFKVYMAKQILSYCEWVSSKDWEWEEN